MGRAGMDRAGPGWAEQGERGESLMDIFRLGVVQFLGENWGFGYCVAKPGWCMFSCVHVFVFSRACVFRFFFLVLISSDARP